MSRLIKSTAILAFARVTNFAIVLLSPVLLVRFLDTHTFGQYREFIVYSLLASTLAAFSIKTNLLYFIPKEPERTKSFVNNTLWISLGASLVACLLLVLFRDLFLSRTSFNFLIPLLIYVFLFTNLDFLESFWLANKQTRNVLYYSVARTIFRLAAVIGTAAVFPDVDSLITALLVVEAVRIVAVVLIMHRLGLKIGLIDASVIRNQLSFIVPLGLAGSMNSVNQYIGQIAISTQLGVVALAVYAIGAYQVPVLRIIRGSINDAIFPDMVREASSSQGDNLRLWKRSNIAYTCLIVPISVLLFCYADELIPLVFTNEYSDAVPIFRILLWVMVLQCFEFSSPLRAVNRNRILLVGNIVMLSVNVALIYLFFQLLESRAIYGPAYAIVCSYVAQLLFLGSAIVVVYSISPGDLVKWRSLAAIFGSAAFSSVLLIVGEQLDIAYLVRVPLFSVLYLVSYFLLIRFARLEEVETLLRVVSRRFGSP